MPSIVGLGALKYFILKVDARKNMTFNPKESIDYLIILYATIGILGVFMGDVAMMLVDPRITLVGKEEAR